jgi:predicted Zn-dependent protease
MPGGVVGVHTGLIMAAANESELASVLGHEIGHVTQHHMARMLAKQKTDTFKNIAGIAVALLMARANPQLASGAMTASTAAGVQRELDYTREHEREADRVGLSIMQKSGFDPRAMPAFFNTLQRGSRFADGNAPSFLRTHPLTAERIADVSNRVENLPYKQVTDSLDFQFVRSKLRVSSSSAQMAIDQFSDNIKEGHFASETAEHYGLALALVKKNDLVNAGKELQWLKQHVTKNAFVENLAARFEVARNNPQSAGKVYELGIKTYPNNRALIYGYVEHYLAINQSNKAITLLQEKQKIYPADSYMYSMLSKAYAMQGKDLLKFQTQGEAYFRQYNLDKAIEQMELAVQSKDGTFYEKSIAEARLKELKRQREIEKPT